MVPISTIFEKLLCGRRSLDAEDAAGVELGKPLPGSDAVEASRRRYTSHLSYCWLGICPNLRNAERVKQDLKEDGYSCARKVIALKVPGIKCGESVGLKGCVPPSSF